MYVYTKQADDSGERGGGRLTPLSGRLISGSCQPGQPV